MQWKLRRVGLTEAAPSLLTKRSLASGPSGVLGQSGLLTEFQTSLDLVRPYLNNQN